MDAEIEKKPHYITPLLLLALAINLILALIVGFQYPQGPGFMGNLSTIYSTLGATSVLGAVLIALNQPRYGAWIFSFSSVLFVPIGFVGIYAAGQVIKKLNEQDLAIRRKKLND